MTPRRITRSDPEWPDRLNEPTVANPPLELFLEGRQLATDGMAVAVVGARRPTSTGLQVAAEFGRGLAEAGLPVVSGMAIGVDSAAHRAALDVGGYTVAVLGCGLDVDYPRRNARLKEAIRATGTVLSEHPSGTPPRAVHFPARNRIIAGLCEAVVFVEGAARSGGLITARYALDANRSVFAVPGSVRNPLAAGPNELIRTSQAGVATSVQHVLEDIAPGLVWGDHPYHERFGHPPANPTERALLSFLDDGPTTLDQMCDGLGLAFGEVAMGLAALEVRNFVVKRSGGYCVTDAGSRVRKQFAPDDEEVACRAVSTTGLRG